jgi:hypothetical protein
MLNSKSSILAMRKICSLTLVFFVIFVIIPTKKIHATDVTAGAGSGWANLGTNIAKFIEGVPGTSSEVMQQVGKFALDVVGKAVATSILQTMATEVINWAGSGFEGNPFADQNQSNTLASIKASEMTRLFREVQGGNDFGSIPNNLSLNTMLNLVNTEITPFKERIQPTFQGQEKTEFINNFAKGGWEAYGKISQMRNNPTGIAILTGEELGKRITQRQDEKIRELNWGSGIQSATKCIGGFVSDAATGFEYCKQEVVQTAGKLVGDQIGKAIGSSMDQSTQASASGDLGSIVSSMLSGILTDLIYKGLGSIGGNSNPQPVNPFASLVALQGSDPNFQTSGGSQFKAREIVDINKELNTALELTKRDIEENLLASITTLSGPILTLTIALDKCIPGPQLGYEDRLQRYFRVILTKDGLEEDAREDGGDLASFYSRVNMAFGEYLGKAKSLVLADNLISIDPRFDSPLQWIDQVNELGKHGTTLANLQDEYNEKQKVLIRLQSLKRQILNQSAQLDVILFNNTWETLPVEGLNGKEARFNTTLSSFSVNPNEWENLPDDEKRRIARLFNENIMNWSLDTTQKSRRLAFYEMFNIPILNSDGTLNTTEPTPTEKRDAVIADGWKKWEEYMNQDEQLQEQRNLIIRNLVESRNSYTTERSFDMNKAKLQAVKAAEERLAESIFSCQKARYEVINADEVVPNRRTLVIPIPMPESSEILAQANITFGDQPSIQRIHNVTKNGNDIYIQASYERATVIWIEYSNHNDLDALPNSAINRSTERTISREAVSGGEIVLQLSGNYNPASYDSNTDTYIIGNPVSLASFLNSSNSIYFTICARNNLGTQCTNQEQIQGNQVVENEIPDTPPTQSNYSFGEVLAGYSYFRPSGINIPTPPGMTNPEIFSPAAITVFNAEIQSNGNIRGRTAPLGSSGQNLDRRLLRLRKGVEAPGCNPVALFLTMGLSAASCAGNSVGMVNNIPGIPILRSYEDQYKWGQVTSNRSAAIEVEFYQPENFIIQTIAEGNPATHQGENGNNEVLGYPTYINFKNNNIPIPNPVIVVRDWHWEHPRNGVIVMNDFTRSQGCDFAGFGSGQAGTAGGRYFGPHCNATDDKDDISFWYEARAFDYLVALYPRLRQFVR